MKFGLFDHVDRSEDRSLARQFDERLDYVAAAERAGFYCYHVAEHHATPLNMVPSPSVFLAAVARATTSLRFGPLVYLLPLYTPFRLIEEICMLDHLSNGRLDVGVGRGVSPFELNYAKVDPETSREVFIDAFDAIMHGLTHDHLSYAGKHFSYTNVPMELRPLQKPYPPIWYASSNEVGSRWAGERGTNFCTLGASERAKDDIRVFRETLAKRAGGPAVPNPDFSGGCAIGIMRHAVIADSVEEARRIALPAYEYWFQSLTKLERLNMGAPRVSRSMQNSIDEAIEKGSAFIGTPDTVRAGIERQVRELGLNYMIFSFFFGSMALKDALCSLSLFAREVMPKLHAL
jgi:alkanesulfonate monooxygenase SsuD/methylene tetrahydromethanopterin reductase-like flavin-dependent oxidoreductase (luciferase family)